ncbi:DNA polymerase III subunit theta [Sodalis praecaptivus]|uniref:DNA polymerase III subunit theta n=1 Tax=Sodalis praecaptivus TaxID=1239307 RepID=UPI0004B2D0AA
MARQQPEHFRAYFAARLAHYRQRSQQLPDANDARYTELEESGKKGNVMPHLVNVF